jgi:hypothetical protein
MDALSESAIRATLIALSTALILRLLRVAAPSMLHAAWSAVTVVMLLLPAIVLWAPKAMIPVVSVDRVTLPLLHQLSEASPATARSIRAESPPPEDHGAWRPLIVVYVTGVLVFALRLAVGLQQARRLGRSAQMIAGRLTHPGCVTPITVGVLKPTVILPTTWQEWSSSDLAAVLVHEQEHVRRNDPLVVLIALVNRAVFWFHPLAWWLHRQVARLAEEACDVAVVSRGHEARNYAECLRRFAVLTAAARGRWNSLGLQMPGRGVAARIDRILAGGPQPPPSRTHLAATALLCSTAVIICAAATPTSSAQSQPLPQSAPAETTGVNQPSASLWQTSASVHFDVYHQRVPAARLEEIIGMAERAYDRISADFEHDLADRVFLILVSRQRDVPANSTAAHPVIAASGAPVRGDHIVLGVDAFADRSDLIVHELTHRFLFDIIPEAGASFTWLSEGVAEFERGTWNPAELAAVRQAAAEGRIPAVDTLGADDRQWGHAVVDFVGAEFGRDGLRRYLAALRRQPQLDAASQAAFDLPLSEFNRRFVAYVTKTFARV